MTILFPPSTPHRLPPTTRVKANGKRQSPHLAQMLSKMATRLRGRRRCGEVGGAGGGRHHKWHVPGHIFVQVYGDKRCHLPLSADDWPRYKSHENSPIRFDTRCAASRLESKYCTDFADGGATKKVLSVDIFYLSVKIV